MPFKEYLKNIKKKYEAGISTEHSYRGDLQYLLQNIVKGITVTNEPKRQKCGAPDYIIQKKEVPIGYIEAKDIGVELDKIEKTNQLKRYLSSLDNLILTDYMEFRFFKFRKKVKTIKIASVENGKFKTYPENYASFNTHINDFCQFKGQTINSSEKLAKMMAQKARMMEEVIYNAVKEDDENNTLKDQLEAFRQILIHDLDEKKFADIYAQTIAYGLFAARLHDDSLEDFSRQEARELIPRSNPFLRNLFDYISGVQLDERIVWIVNDLADIFRASDLQALLADFGKSTGQNDPFIHFYETFLAEYDSKLRKSRGVYYTPESVVNFIVRAIEEILKTEFDLPNGLADTSKTQIEVDTQVNDKRYKGKVRKESKEVHKVQILDPATGTGTFLAEVINQIYQRFVGQEGNWSNYVEKELIPRLNGFEILMASYTMCHLKLELMLRMRGYKPKDENKQPRLRVFLTNSLEEVHPDTGTLFASWLSKEATSANYVKKDTPVMVVLGNPPYANFGQMNQGDWINKLIETYKHGLNERKINLDDDYIKFIRYGQYYIEKNGEGILAYISNNSFIDGVTHRQMRKSLLDTFNKIYILDLHGNAKKKETTPQGEKDENVFDIQQGVSINIFIKTKRKTNTEVFHFDLWGTRTFKNHYLFRTSFVEIPWNIISQKEPYFFFIPYDDTHKTEYMKGFSIKEIFHEYVSGFQTKRDKVTIQFSKNEIDDIKNTFTRKPCEEIRSVFGLPKDGRDWKIEWAKSDLQNNNPKVIKVMYRPFDNRYTYYTGKSKGFIGYPRAVMYKHLLIKENLCLITCRQQSTFDFQHVFVSRLLSDMCNISSQTKETGYIFPLYIINKNDNSDNNLFSTNDVPFKLNFNIDIINTIMESINIEYMSENVGNDDNIMTPMDVFNYIYAVLHSKKYRKKYKDLLKIDFPRIPYPTNKDIFKQLAEYGSRLKLIHLLESSTSQNLITSYPVKGDNRITRSIGKKDFDTIDKTNAIGRVWINNNQFFDNISVTAWDFYIGGYQPAQKWLKDRKGRELDYNDILHYQKIIVALVETDKIMKDIDEVIQL